VDEATDVLSFAQGEIRGGRYIAGDIAVSLDMVVENAKAFAVPPGEELRRLILHGILHLDGMDHRGPVGVHTEPPVSEPMLVLQERLLQDLDGPGIMEFRGP
jgi:probable rRNA maturation factor